MSKSLTAVQRNYATHDRELYAIVEACCHWRPYMLDEGLADAGPSIWFDDGPRHADAGRELDAQSNKASRFQGQVALTNQKTTTNVEQSYLSIQLPSVRKFTRLCLPL